MNNLKLIVCLISSIFLNACSSDDDNSSSGSDLNLISDRSFTGTINGEKFIPVAGNGRITFAGFKDGSFVDDDGIEKLSVRISDETFTCNDIIFTEQTNISVTIPTEAKESQKLNVVTVISGNASPVNDLNGLAQVVSINDTEAVVKIKTDFELTGTTFNLEGKFTVAICPQDN